MALAEPVLRQFGVQKLRNVRIRGGSLLGSAIGAGIGIGSGLIINYDVTWPWSTMLQPKRSPRGVPSVGNGSSSTYASTYQFNQALRTKTLGRGRFRRYTKSSNCKCCHTKCCC